MSIRFLCMECSRQYEGEGHICIGEIGWTSTALRLIWRIASAQGRAMWN